jgi:excisionase family DNA binding protein
MDTLASLARKPVPASNGNMVKNDLDKNRGQRQRGLLMRTYQVQEVAKLLGIAPSTVYDLARQRKIAHRRIGTGRGRIVFTDKDIEDFLNSCRVEALSMPAASRFTHGK